MKERCIIKRTAIGV